MAGQPQAFQWAAPNQAKLTFCTNKPKLEGDVPGDTLWDAPQGTRPAALPRVGLVGVYRLLLQLLPWTLPGGEHSKLRQDFRAPGSHREYRAGSSVPGDLSSFSCLAVLLGCDATETATRSVADGQGGGHGPQESPFLPALHLGTWARRRRLGQQRGEQPPLPYQG